MEVRRRHGECKVGVGEKGCEVVQGRDCGGGRGRKWGTPGFSVMALRGGGKGLPLSKSGWVIMWVVGLLVASLSINLWMVWRHHLEDETISR